MTNRQHYSKITVAAVLWSAASAMAQIPESAPQAGAPNLSISASKYAASTAPATRYPNLWDLPTVPDHVLANRNGGTDIGTSLSDMKLRGVVTDNRAVNVATGTNLISEGAFANSSGLPMVIQNSGNNVLIQNATIVNIKLQ